MKGRINRRAFVVGNLVGLGILLGFTVLIVFPLAVLDLVINVKSIDAIIAILYYAVIFPAILYYCYFCILMVKRAHDIGWPGLLLVVGFTLLLVAGQLFELFFLNVLCVLVVLFFALKPGMKSRNTFGPAPHRKFSLSQIKVTF